MNRTQTYLWALALVLAPAGEGGVRAAPAGRVEDLPAPALPAGVADAAGRTGYVPNAGGGIDALDLETGQVLWTSPQATKPLAVAGRRLVAQAPETGKANSVRIVVLDVTQKGKRVLQSDPVVFPDWVVVGTAHGRSFASAGRLHQGDLLLRWRAGAFYAGGAAPPPEVLRRARKSAAGVARVSLDTGRVEMLAPDKVPAPAAVKLPEGLEKVAARPHWNGFEQEKRVHVAGSHAVAPDVEFAGGKQKLVLRRWQLSDGKALAPVTLLEGKALRVEVGSDGGTVLVHQSLTRQALPPGDYAWWAFSLETGERVAKFPYEEGTVTATVLGPRAYYLVQVPSRGGRPDPFTLARALKAVDLKSGKLLWERPVEGRRMLPQPP
jgi:hypothetical protein